MKIKKFVIWFVLILLGLYFVGVLIRIPFLIKEEKTEEAVMEIRGTKLTLADVMGENLPPEPDPELNNATLEGIDANENGIRDDVELAIFAEYDSPRTRAALLQYALALQMQFTQPIVNTQTVTEVIREQSRADACVSDTIVPRSLEYSRTYADVEKIDKFINFVKDKQLNTELRIDGRKDFISHLGSYSESENITCDIDLSNLPN